VGRHGLAVQARPVPEPARVAQVPRRRVPDLYHQELVRVPLRVRLVLARVRVVLVLVLVLPGVGSAAAVDPAGPRCRACRWSNHRTTGLRPTT
jgi:hypothetical protein